MPHKIWLSQTQPELGYLNKPLLNVTNILTSSRLKQEEILKVNAAWVHALIWFVGSSVVHTN